MRSVPILALLLAATPALAEPQLAGGRLILAPGDWAVVRLDAASVPALVRQGDFARTQPIAPGELRARLATSADGKTLLIVENATPTPLDYDAALYLATGEQRAIRPCSLGIGSKPTYELWRSVMASISIGNFKAIDPVAAHCP